MSATIMDDLRLARLHTPPGFRRRRSLTKQRIGSSDIALSRRRSIVPDRKARHSSRRTARRGKCEEDPLCDPAARRWADGTPALRKNEWSPVYSDDREEELGRLGSVDPRKHIRRMGSRPVTGVVF